MSKKGFTPPTQPSNPGPRGFEEPSPDPVQLPTYTTQEQILRDRVEDLETQLKTLSERQIEKDHESLARRIKLALSVLGSEDRFSYPETTIQNAIKTLKGEK